MHYKNFAPINIYLQTNIGTVYMYFFIITVDFYIYSVLVVVLKYKQETASMKRIHYNCIYSVELALFPGPHPASGHLQCGYCK